MRESLNIQYFHWPKTKKTPLRAKVQLLELEADMPDAYA